MRGGVSILQISLKFKNVSNIRYGGGGQAYLGHCQKISCFLIMMPPLSFIGVLSNSKVVLLQVYNLQV